MKTKAITTAVTNALLACVFLFPANQARAAEGALIGRVSEVKPATREVIVSSARAGELIRMNDRLYVRIEGQIVIMRAVFPMQTIARCLVEPKYQDKIDQVRKGMLVYRYFAGAEKSESRQDQPVLDDGNANQVKNAIIAFEQYVPWSDVDQGFRSRQVPWHQDVRSAPSPAALAKLLVEFENWILRERFTNEWQAQRQTWIDKTLRTASYAEISRSLEELRSFYRRQ